MASAVLRDRVAYVRAQTEVGDGGFVVAPFVDGEALVQDEAFAVEDLVAHRRQAGCHVGQLKVGRVDPRQGQLLCEKGVGGGGEFGDLSRGEDVRPLFRV